MPLAFFFLVKVQKSNKMHEKRVVGKRGIEGGRNKGRIDVAQRIFIAVKILCDTVMMGTLCYIVVQTHRMCNSKSEP